MEKPKLRRFWSREEWDIYWTGVEEGNDGALIGFAVAAVVGIALGFAVAHLILR